MFFEVVLECVQNNIVLTVITNTRAASVSKCHDITR